MKYKRTQVMLNTPKAINYSGLYYLENIEDKLNQLFKGTAYRVYIGNNDPGRLCISMSEANQIVFDIYIENLDDNIFSYKILGCIDQEHNDFNLVRVSLEGCITHNGKVERFVHFPKLETIKVRFKKIETIEEFFQTETKFQFGSD
jgi:hypothetical protein